MPFALLLLLGMTARAEEAPSSHCLVTWNVENLFDEHDDPEREDEVRTKREVDQKLANLAAVLRKIGSPGPPDVIAIQEANKLPLYAEKISRDLNYNAVWKIQNSLQFNSIIFLIPFVVRKKYKQGYHNPSHKFEPAWRQCCLKALQWGLQLGFQWGHALA